MTSVFTVADRYVEANAAQDPIFATHLGLSSGDERLNDYSPDGLAAAERLERNAVLAMEQAAPTNDHDRIARNVMIERLSQSLKRRELGEPLRNLNPLHSPLQAIRSVFDLMPRDTTSQWRSIGRRMADVPRALAGAETSLRMGQERGLSAARRQALACARQASVWAGGHETDGFFTGLTQDYLGRSGADRKVEDLLAKSAAEADAAFGRFATFLTDTYAPAATEDDGVGAERYASAVTLFLGAGVDPLDAYQWGWEELARIRADISAVCEQLAPGLGFTETVAKLNAEYGRVLQGEDALRDWLQALMTNTIAELDGKHFDIPEPLKRLEVRIAPPGGSAAQYYVGPSEDFERPGTYWYPTNGRSHFPLWSEISTAYHEGVPGHHLQIGQVRLQSESLSRFQRSIIVSGQAEGWALYAERLMDELGYLDRPEYRLDMLANALFRAARVVVDVGMHLGLTIPTHETFHPGEKWNAELGLGFMLANSSQPEAFLRSEIDRYLGLPAQAISYKLGERLWLEARAEAKQRAGSAFDLKQFHMSALSLGPMGLDQLKAELSLL